MRIPRVFVQALVLLTLIATGASAQRRITGRVTDKASGNPLAGATINVVGSLVGTTATEDGRFTLNVPSAAIQLSVRQIGYKRVVVSVPESQTEVNASLDKDIMKLEEVVVTGTATTMDRRNAATATQSLSAEEVARVPAVDLTNALQGKVIGARINMNSGAPGGGGQIQIRGVTSLNGSGEPLFVVDGVLISNASIPSGANSITRAGGGISGTQDNMVNRLADVNPADIESIEILKSAAASSMYGSRASNGVVIITTKRGRAGAPRFTLSQRVGAYSSLKLLDSRRFKDTVTLLEAAGCTAGTACAGNPGASYIRSNITGNNIPHFDLQGDLYSGGAPTFETTATVSGGTENGGTRYFASGTNRYDDGTLLNTGSRLQSMRTSIDQLFGNKWSVNMGASVTRTYAARGLSNNDNTNTSPFYVLAYTPAVLNLNQRQASGAFVQNPFAGGGSSSSNPFETHTYILNDENVYREMANASVSYDAWNSAQHRIQLRGIMGVDRFTQADEVYSPNFLQYEPKDALLGVSAQSSSLSRQWNGSLNGVWSYTPTNNWFKATSSAGMGVEHRYLNILRIRGDGLLPGVRTAAQGTNALQNTITQVEDQFFFAQEEFLFLQERASATFGMRAERSSNNGDRAQYFTYPKAAAAYRFEEPLPMVNSVKLRASIGKTGNQPDYGRRDLTLGNGGLIDGRSSLAAPSVLGNPNLEPEKLTELEFGMDAAFWDSRIGFEGTRFTRTITDMFLFVPLPPTSGTGSKIDNAGTMETKGWELGLTASPIRRRDVDWTSRATFFTFDGRITELPVPAFLTSSGFGSAFGRARAYCPGLTAAGAPTLATGGKCGAPGIEPGSITAIWGNRTRCDAIDVIEKGCTLDAAAVDTIIGDATPDFEMTFSNDVRYKNFNLSVLVEMRQGGDVSNMTQTLFDEGYNSWDYDKASPYPTFNPSGAATPSLGQYRYDRWNGGRQASSYIQDGSFVKLREVSLTYQVPTTVVRKYIARASDVKLTLSGRNLKMWSDYWGVDPEVNNFGNANVARQVDLAPFPTTKSFFFSVTMGF